MRGGGGSRGLSGAAAGELLDLVGVAVLEAVVDAVLETLEVTDSVDVVDGVALTDAVVVVDGDGLEVKDAVAVVDGVALTEAVEVADADEDSEAVLEVDGVRLKVPETEAVSEEDGVVDRLGDMDGSVQNPLLTWAWSQVSATLPPQNAQDWQKVWPGSENTPTAQFWQADVPVVTALNLPAAHAVQPNDVSAPNTLPYAPASQATQVSEDVAPLRSLYLPRAQLVQPVLTADWE